VPGFPPGIEEVEIARGTGPPVVMLTMAEAEAVGAATLVAVTVTEVLEVT
jgi:hypothetical protein